MATPEELQLEYVGVGSVLLRWTTRRDDIVLATVQRVYLRQEGGEFTLHGETKDATELLLEQLRPNKAYEVYVQSCGVVGGTGPKSQMAHFNMPPLPPQTAPTNLRLQYRGGSKLGEVEAAWGPGVPGPEEAPLEGYTLFYDLEGSEEFVELELGAERTTYVAQGLRPGVTYRFQVLAFNGSGEGPLTDIVSYTTPDNQSEGGPRSPAPTASRHLAEGAIAGSRGTRSPVGSPRITANHSPVPLSISQPETPTSPWGPRKSPSKGATFMPSPIGKRATGFPNPSPAVDSEASTFGSGREPNLVACDFKIPSKAERRSPKSSPKGGKKPVNFQTEEKKCGGTEGLGEEPSGLQASPSKHPHMEQLAAELDAVAILDSKKAPEEEQYLGSQKPQKLNQGNRKTIRGKVNGVRRAKELLMRDVVVQSSGTVSKFYEKEKDGTIVVYTTSVSVVRGTHQLCQDISKVFSNMRLRVTSRDISLDTAFAKELEERLPGASVPQVFVNGIHFGNHTKVMQLNETGELKRLLVGFEERPNEDCSTCGGVGFVNCTWCRGSKKSFSHKFELHDRGRMALKCTACNENGLQRCPGC